MPGAWGRETISVTRQPFAADPQNVNLTSEPCGAGKLPLALARDIAEIACAWRIIPLLHFSPRAREAQSCGGAPKGRQTHSPRNICRDSPPQAS
jgi:hypothetical protein